mmetsp:Transcript_25267/g.64216  ORF Transcript_25267/g.64216 Transcript_25267/m.64216 type:complete len:212 (+) Transcript_25267:233-868(+)
MGAAPSEAGGSGAASLAGGAAGLGTGRVVMGRAKRSSASRFLLMSATSSSGGACLGRPFWMATFSFTQASAASASLPTAALSSAGMCAVEGTSWRANARYDSAVCFSASTAAGRAWSSAKRVSTGPPRTLSSSSLATYTDLVQSSPSSYSQSSHACSAANRLSFSSGLTYASSSPYSLLRSAYTYASTAFLRSLVSSCSRSVACILPSASK